MLVRYSHWSCTIAKVNIAAKKIHAYAIVHYYTVCIIIIASYSSLAWPDHFLHVHVVVEITLW